MRNLQVKNLLQKMKVFLQNNDQLNKAIEKYRIILIQLEM